MTLDQLFGADSGGGALGSESIGDLLSSLDDEEDGGGVGRRCATTSPQRPTTSW
jgi:hypothetical protein